MASERKTLGSTAVQKDQRCNQDLFGSDRSPSLPSRGALSRAATHGADDHATDKGDVTDVTRQFADIQRQNGAIEPSPLDD